MSGSPHIYLIVGEPSGDRLGADLVEALRSIDSSIRFSGLAGPAMEEKGLTSLFPISDLAVMGLAEVLPHIPKLLGRIKETREDILRKNPDAVVTIDAPGFGLRVVRPLKQGKTALRTSPLLVHYVAPSVWAWKPGRAQKIAQYLDLLLALLPFEPPYFEKHGLRTVFVGHPAAKPDLLKKKALEGYRSQWLGASGEPVLCLLPGSRRAEIERLLPVFLETIRRLREELPGLQVLLPSLAHLHTLVQEQIEGSNLPIRVLEGQAEKQAAFQLSTAALAASGTVSLELAANELPTVIAYRVNPVSAAIAKRMLKVSFASLPNILANKPIMPEFLQDRCRPELLCEALLPLLLGQSAANAQREELHQAIESLKLDGGKSERAAMAILNSLKERQKAF